MGPTRQQLTWKLPALTARRLTQQAPSAVKAPKSCRSHQSSPHGCRTATIREPRRWPCLSAKGKLRDVPGRNAEPSRFLAHLSLGLGCPGFKLGDTRIQNLTLDETPWYLWLATHPSAQAASLHCLILLIGLSVSFCKDHESPESSFLRPPHRRSSTSIPLGGTARQSTTVIEFLVVGSNMSLTNDSRPRVDGQVSAQLVKKPPFSVDASGYEKKDGETIPRRHPMAKDKLITLPADEVQTVFDNLRRAAAKFGNAKAIGTRKLIKTHVENKKVKKIVDGQEQEVEKKWTYFELSGYNYISFVEYEKMALDCGAGLRYLGLTKENKMHLYGATR